MDNGFVLGDYLVLEVVVMSFKRKTAHLMGLERFLSFE